MRDKIAHETFEMLVSIAVIAAGAELLRIRPVKLSITHNFCPDDGAQPDVGEA